MYTFIKDVIFIKMISFFFVTVITKKEKEFTKKFYPFRNLVILVFQSIKSLMIIDHIFRTLKFGNLNIFIEFKAMTRS